MFQIVEIAYLQSKVRLRSSSNATKPGTLGLPFKRKRMKETITKNMKRRTEEEASFKFLSNPTYVKGPRIRTKKIPETTTGDHQETATSFLLLFIS